MTVASMSDALAQCERCVFCVGAEHPAEFVLLVACALPTVRLLHRPRVAPPQKHIRAGPQEVRRILHYTQRNRSLSSFALPFPIPHVNASANSTCLPLSYTSSQSYPSLLPSHHPLSHSSCLLAPCYLPIPHISLPFTKDYFGEQKNGQTRTCMGNRIDLSITGVCSYWGRKLVSWNRPCSLLRQKFIFAVQQLTVSSHSETYFEVGRR